MEGVEVWNVWRDVYTFFVVVCECPSISLVVVDWTSGLDW